MAPQDIDQFPPDQSSPTYSVHKTTRLVLIVSVVVAVAAGFAGGYGYFQYRNAHAVDTIIKEVANRDAGQSSAVDFGLFWQVWDRLHERFVDSGKLDAQKLVYGAIGGMVDAAGDPYTVFMEPVQSKAFQEEVSGAFGGVGMELGKRNNVITVIAPLKDTPASRAGILAGDVVVKVDNQETAGWSTEEAVSHIRGKKGTTVHLTMFREGDKEYREIDLVRDTIRVPSVEWKMLDGKVAYLQVYAFSGNVDEDFAKAGKEILAAGATRIILDLRNNPGGLLDSAVNLAGWFLADNSLVVQEKFGDGQIEELRSSGSPKFAGLPVVILINGGSASASEILAGAIHDIRDIRLVGEKSFGKGSVQQLESFYNGSTLKVTIAKWLTPKGVSISDTGIEPTDKVEMKPADAEKSDWEIGTPGKDPQLDKAIGIIKNL